MIRNDSFSRHTGGVLVYLRKNISFEVMSCMTDNENWLLTIKVKTVMKFGLYSVLYASPSASKCNFLRYIGNVFEQISSQNLMHVLVGDFNINYNDDFNTYTRQLKHIINLHGLQQKVCDFTRITKTSRTIIDLLVTNDVKVKIYNILNTCRISDHSILELVGLSKKCDNRNHNHLECIQATNFMFLLTLIRGKVHVRF
jgi:hypothetical protein